MRVPYEVTEDLYVHASNSYQTHGGHHTMLYFVEGTSPIVDTPHECTPEDMGNAAAFLCSDEASMITGSRWKSTVAAASDARPLRARRPITWQMPAA